MFSEDDLLPISALQHLLFCERQCALIHLEQQWAENRLTVEGQHLHRRAHERKTERRDGVHIVRGLAVRSMRYGVIGQTDDVEFTPLDDAARDWAAQGRPNRRGAGLAVVSVGKWQVAPVEYKRGQPKKDDCDRVQLTAQALCLEEMLATTISAGALFYGRNRRRTEVAFGPELRERTAAAIRRLHALIASRCTPPARREPKCDNCSLLALCMPDVLPRGRGMAGQFDRALTAHLASAGPKADD